MKPIVLQIFLIRDCVQLSVLLMKIHEIIPDITAILNVFRCSFETAFSAITLRNPSAC
jgi:hypothetical protein